MERRSGRQPGGLFGMTDRRARGTRLSLVPPRGALFHRRRPMRCVSCVLKRQEHRKVCGSPVQRKCSVWAGIGMLPESRDAARKKGNPSTGPASEEGIVLGTPGPTDVLRMRAPWLLPGCMRKLHARHLRSFRGGCRDEETPRHEEHLIPAGSASA